MINEFLKRNELTAYRLAKIAKYSEATISRWISGERQMPEHTKQHLELLEYYKNKEGKWPNE